ncbi:hypothetical protein [Streptomyces sp. NPDC008001]|uniref:hypothetical protein n=1 Tax=Streptomyces sp. NPDC008001 TaxID=3364804 RepID=UPI0036ECED7E
MTKLFLSLHVLAAVVAVGPVTVAASMFPAALRRARQEAGDGRPSLATLRLLHRICRVYAVAGIAVPVFGFATAGSLGVLGSGWLIVSIALTAAAAGVLALLVLPAQERELASVQDAHSGPVTTPAAPPKTPPLGSPAASPAISPVASPVSRTTGRLAMHTGIFNLLWATVTVLMVIRPGSTTGA